MTVSLVSSVSLALAAALFAAPAAAQIPACVAAEMDALAFSGAVHAVRDGRPALTEARGSLGEASSAAITAETTFSVGSLNKMFTAVAIGQLVDAGKLRFDDPLGRRVGGLPPALAKVTLHQLLTHTSGAGNYFVSKNRGVIASARTAADLVPLIAAEPLQFEPGSKQAYSNSGFVLLGAVVEQVTGQTYESYVSENIFKPAGMGATSLRRGPSTATPMTRMDPATGERSGDLRPSPMSPAFGSPAGSAFSTVADLARFADALMANRLTRPETTRTLTSLKVAPEPGAAGSRGGYAYGFTVSGEGDDLRIGHGGGSGGVNAELAIYPARSLVVAVLANRDPPAATRVARALESAMITVSCGAA
jgi:CubicO group peptidase (beta-lactamase class C family)